MRDAAERAEAIETVLADSALSTMVDVVLRRDGDTYRAMASRGSVTFRHDARGTSIIAEEGDNPLADDDTHRFVGLEAELASELPHPAAEARPHAYDEVAQFFDSPHAPDLAVVHTASHRYHGNVGEHGSLGTVQRRAPFIAAGPGVRADGWVTGAARTVDVAPTVAALAGVAPRRGRGRFGEQRDDVLLARQDGNVLDTIVDPAEGAASHVLLVLWDGCNANELRAAVDAGEAPNAAGLISRGTALDGGILASYPSATLANHTTIGTGAMPGHSGILHNEWRCGDTGSHRNLLDLAQMFDACDHLAEGIETLHEAVKRTFPDAWTGSTHEFCDRGADFSSFRSMARREPLSFARGTDEFPRDGRWWETSARYHQMTRVDETALRCALGFWADGHPVPRFAFCSFALTDEAGHEGGPHSDEVRAAIRDCDERLGRLLGAVERRGVLDDTAVVLVADHGMQRTSDEVTGDFADALGGLDHVAVDQMFLYVD